MNSYLFFDLETTGTSPTNDRAVQLSAVKLDEYYKPVERTNILINPGVSIPKEATAIHGITDEMVANRPQFAMYAKSLHELFSNVILGGFNIKVFDVPLLSEEFARVGISWPQPGVKIVDAYKIFSIKERRDLTAAVKFYTGKTFADAHNAETDVDATIDVFLAQLERYPDLFVMNPAAMHLFCDEGTRPVDLAGKIILNDEDVPCFSFGKSKGVPVKKDIGFAQWMLKNDFSTDTKNAIKAILSS